METDEKLTKMSEFQRILRLKQDQFQSFSRKLTLFDETYRLIPGNGSNLTKIYEVERTSRLKKDQFRSFSENLTKLDESNRLIPGDSRKLT